MGFHTQITAWLTSRFTHPTDQGFCEQLKHFVYIAPSVFRTPSISIAHYFTPTIIHHIWHSNNVNRLPILVCLTFEFLGIQIGAELSLISNLIIPNPQRADMRKQHKMTVQGREAIPCPKLKMEGKVMFTIEAFLCPNFHCQS